MRPVRAAALTLCVLLGSSACGDDGGGATADAATTIDAAPTIDAVPRVDAIACTTDLAPADDNGIPADLVISEIDPGDFIELYNNTDQPIALATIDHQLCSPFSYRSLATLGPGVIIGPRGFATVPWPTGFVDDDAAGEVILYKDAAFTQTNSLLDFVCWGPTRPSANRKQLAEDSLKWSANCAGPITGGSIHRVMGSDGTTAASYDVASAPSPTTCE